MPVPAYIRAQRTATGFKGTIVLNGEDRWMREGSEHYVASALRKCYPGIDHVITTQGEVLDTGCLTLAECIEASAF